MIPIPLGLTPAQQAAYRHRIISCDDTPAQALQYIRDAEERERVEATEQLRRAA